ncbi:MAG: hypothetical protein PHQ40_22040, partial [Anaerolineaceae bacterium]|nr:hypothetical protein [Anaerolineaceae bacterium]
TDARNNTTVTLTNAFGQVLKVTPPTGGPAISYEYYPTGNLYKVKQPKDATSTWDTVLSYDLAWRKTSMDDPDMGHWSYTYDAVGNLLTQVDAANNATCLFYDSANRLKGKTWRAAGQGACPESDPGSYPIAYDYDGYWHNGQQLTYVDDDGVTQSPTSPTGKGLRTAMWDASGKTIWLYDSYGRVTSEVREVANGLGTYTIGYGYFANSDQLQSITYPKDGNGTGETVTFAIDNRKLPISLYSQTNAIYYAGGYGSTATPAHHDQIGRLTSLLLGNNLLESYGFNPIDSPTAGEGGRLHTKTVGGSLSLTYHYDPNGNITGVDDVISGATQSGTYQYDSLNRLFDANVPSITTPNGVVAGYQQSYTFDPNSGNQVSVTKDASNLSYGYKGTSAHAVTSAGTNSYGYDENGNMTNRTEGGISYSQSWSEENRLKLVTWTDSGITYQTGFIYDGDGKLSLKIERMTNGGETVEYTTVYVGGIFEQTLATTNLLSIVTGNQP